MASLSAATKGLGVRRGPAERSAALVRMINSDGTLTNTTAHERKKREYSAAKEQPAKAKKAQQDNTRVLVSRELRLNKQRKRHRKLNRVFTPTPAFVNAKKWVHQTAAANTHQRKVVL